MQADPPLRPGAGRRGGRRLKSRPRSSQRTHGAAGYKSHMPHTTRTNPTFQRAPQRSDAPHQATRV
eukprot:7967278-Alexandrium_andersonii.AAC.1